MRPWPRSAYVTILVLLVVFGFALRVVYTETRASYKAVGFNDGQIDQREQTMKKIQQLVGLEVCRKDQETPEPIEFLSVKADSVYLIITEGHGVQFCR